MPHSSEFINDGVINWTVVRSTAGRGEEIGQSEKLFGA